MSQASVDYQTEELVAGETKSVQKLLTEGVYKRAMVLGRNDTTKNYTFYNSAGVDGTQNVKAILKEDITVGAGLTALADCYVAGSEVNSGALLDANGDPINVTQTLVESAQDSFILIR